MINTISILLFIIGIITGLIVMFVIINIKNSKKQDKVNNILKKAYDDAEELKSNALNEARKEAKQYKEEIENDLKEKKQEIKESEKRLANREESIDRRDENLQNRENMLDEKEKKLQEKQDNIQDEQAKVEKVKQEQLDLLEKISGYSKKVARDLVLKRVEEEMNLEISAYIKERETEAKLEADKKARQLASELL